MFVVVGLCLVSSVSVNGCVDAFDGVWLLGVVVGLCLVVLRYVFGVVG